MKLALNEAWKYQLLTYPNPAVGAVVVKNGKVLSVEAHKKAGEPHAEVLALKMAYLTFYQNSELKTIQNSQEIHNYLMKNHHHFFEDCEIYVTLEPCNHLGKTPACAMLLEAVQIKKVFIGAIDCNKNATGGLKRLQKANIAVEVDVCKEEANQLLYPFKKWQEERFVFFKLAMRSDGTIDGGYITTQDSLEYVHKIRANLDLLVIGGETVRVDKPTLDCRFYPTHTPPDVLIYSRTKDFDNSIPLFHIPNRKVSIQNNTERIKEKNFVMIEGGYNLLASLRDVVDYLVVFVSNKTKTGEQFDINRLGFEVVYQYKINQEDSLIFLKK